MASDLDRALAATVREAVRGSRQSQTNVCLAIGLQPQAFRDRLRGRTRWAAVELQQLADVLGVSVTELLQPIARCRPCDVLEGASRAGAGMSADVWIVRAVVPNP